MNVGQKFSLKYKLPHRIEATIIELREHEIIADVVHRCDPPCRMMKVRETLPLHGTLTYSYRNFSLLYVPMAEDALALPGGKE